MQAKRSPLQLLAIAFLAAVLGVPMTAVAQELPTFSDTVDVRAIHLEVVVTDGKQRLEGLSSEDFQLFVDGQEVPIDFFSEVRHGLAVADSDASGPIPQFAAGESVGTRYLVFVDDSFAIPAYRNRVLNALENQLAQLSPVDRMAVVAFDGHQVELLTSWTRDARELRGAFNRARDRRGQGLHRLAEQRRFDSIGRFMRRGDLAVAGSVFDTTDFRLTRLDAIDLHRGKELAYQVERVVDAAAATLRGFAQPPGRKVMLMLSGGWPFATEAWAAGTYTDYETYSGLSSGRRLFRPLVDTANRLGYTLYPVDLAGFERRSFGSAEFASLAEANAADSVAYRRELIEEDSLQHLAFETGGRALLDGARLTALERVAEDVSSFYWIGFTPDWRQDDEARAIRVKVNRKGVKVRARRSFSDLSPATTRTLLVESAQLFDAPLPSSEGFRVQFGTAASGGLGKVIVPVRLEIPLDQITMLSGAGGFAAHLELRVAATDSRGARAEVPIIPVRIKQQEAPGVGSVAVFETQLKLRRLPHQLLLVVHDPLSGMVLSDRQELLL